MAFFATAIVAFFTPKVEEEMPVQASSSRRRAVSRAETLQQFLGNRDESEMQERFRERFLCGIKRGEKPRMFRVLSLDGGGVRGLYTARLLERLVEVIPDLMDHFDLLAGSSTGSLVSLLLALGHSPKEVVAIYRISAKHIFEYNFFRQYNPFVSKYSNKPIKRILQHIAGATKLGDLARYILICAFCIDGIGDSKGVVKTFFSGGSRGWRPAIFTNLPRGYGAIEPDNLLDVTDAALRSTAAPTFFPIYQGYADGGIFANNPSLVALTRSVAAFSSAVAPSNTAVLSIGTGVSVTAVHGKHHNWGLMRWAPHLIALLFDSTESTINMNMQMLLEDRYFRLDSLLPEPVGLDDVGSLEDLIAYADVVDIGPAVAFLRRVVCEPFEPSQSDDRPSTES